MAREVDALHGGGDISNGRRHIAWIVSEPGFYSQQETVQMEWQSGKRKEFWISELEDGNANSLVNINSNANSEVLKFESSTVNF